MSKYRIKDTETGKEFDLEDFDTESKRFLVKINVSEWEPSFIPEAMVKYQKILKEWFGDEAKFLLVPVKTPEDFVLYEVETDDET